MVTTPEKSSSQRGELGLYLMMLMLKLIQYW